MALDIAALESNRKPIPFPHEQIITTIDTGVIVHLDIPDASGTKKLRATGAVWVTDQRFIFVPAPDSSFDSLTVPLPAILSTRFEQPTFGPNYFAFQVKPSGPVADSGLSAGTQVEVRFKDRAMFEFVALLEKTRERAIYMKRQVSEEALPTYTSPVESSSVPADNPPGYEA